MTSNKLKKNNDKTELLLCGTNAKLKSIDCNSVMIGNEVINFSPKVKKSWNFLRKQFIYGLCCLTLRPYIDEYATERLVLSFVISRLDYCNALFYNMSNSNIQKLQLIQNYAARLVKRAPRRSSASSLLRQLHWLPVKKRIIYKIAILTYNCLYDGTSPSYLKDRISNYIP